MEIKVVTRNLVSDDLHQLYFQCSPELTRFMKRRVHKGERGRVRQVIHEDLLKGGDFEDVWDIDPNDIFSACALY